MVGHRTYVLSLLFSRELETMAHPFAIWSCAKVLHLQLYVVLVVLICSISTYLRLPLSYSRTVIILLITNRRKEVGRIRKGGKWFLMVTLLWNSSIPRSHHVLIFLRNFILTVLSGTSNKLTKQFNFLHKNLIIILAMYQYFQHTHVESVFPSMMGFEGHVQCAEIQAQPQDAHSPRAM